MKRLLLCAVLPAGIALATASPALADQGWVIDSFASQIAVGTDGTLVIQEQIAADFGAQEHHGIFRTIPIRYRYDDAHDRYLDVAVSSVTNNGRPAPYTVANDGTNETIKIGDPNVLVSGVNVYAITYRVTGALNSFSDHDELYWNVDGTDWGVPKQKVSATVTLPPGAFQKATCYQGSAGSTDVCSFRSTTNGVTFSSRPLASDEELTIVTAINKGVVSVPPPLLESRQRQFPQDAFDINPFTVAASLILFLVGVGLIVAYWWSHGRDRAYLGHYYLADDTVHDAPESPFEHEPLVVEFGPPQNLRPATLGLILDETADTKDVTATIVDLAVRGYLTISEVPGQKDWLLSWKPGAPADQLLTYEKTLLDGLFAGRQQVKLSELKGTFQPTLREAEVQVYGDAMIRKLFRIRPDYIRGGFVGAGIVVIVVGCVLAYFLGASVGWGLPGASIALLGAVLIAVHGLMSVRTAAGHDLMHHTLGFRLYMTTAEKYRQQFAEKAEIFTQLLPYAIVFGCVTRWAKAFEGIDTTRQTSSWYVGPGPFQAAFLASTLESMNSSLATAVSSAPAARGGSGFGGGGFSGGGFGGGGGGAW